jgi:hypothetical protein
MLGITNPYAGAILTALVLVAGGLTASAMLQPDAKVTVEKDKIVIYGDNPETNVLTVNNLQDQSGNYLMRLRTPEEETNHIYFTHKGDKKNEINLGTVPNHESTTISAHRNTAYESKVDVTVELIDKDTSQTVNEAEFVVRLKEEGSGNWFW